MESGAASTSYDPIHLAKVTPYSKNNIITQNIKDECSIQTQLPEFIAQFAADNGLAVELGKGRKASGGGRVLDVEITNAVSQGGAFRGHRKLTSIKGTLWEKGKIAGSFEGRRVSGGGFFGGYKGSCSVLGRTVKALGKDVAVWLSAPSMNARLGDL